MITPPIIVIVTASLMLITSIARAAEPPRFEYSGVAGPDNWATLTPAFAACGSGRSQSPINIESSRHEANLPALDISYTTAALDFKNNGHAVQTDYAAGNTVSDAFHNQAPYRAIVRNAEGSTTAHFNETYELKQFHFHSPSEHQRDSYNTAAEIHFVHSDPEGNLAVISVLVEEAATPHPTIARLWESLPTEEGTLNTLDQQINAADLLPKNHAYFFYQGSLTTPPCTEGVRWVVMKEPITMSADQIASLRQALQHDNNRPVQPMYGRVVFE